MSAVPGMDGNTKNLSLAFGRAVRWQIMATALAAVVAFALGGMSAAISAFGGGAAAVAGGYVAVMSTRGRQSATPGGALVLLLRAEVIKIGVIALVLLAIFKLYAGLVPLALIGGLACAALMSGAAMRTLNEQNNI